jgi:transcription antitermination factor NusG
MKADSDSNEVKWFAMRVFNNRILRIKEELEQKGARTYMAIKTVQAPGSGTTGTTAKATAQPTPKPTAGATAKPTTKKIQLAPSLLFVRTTPEALQDFKQAHFTELMIYRRADSTDPAPIPEEEMRMFILVTSATDGRDVDLISEQIMGPDTRQFNFKPGEKVRVTEGPFKGAEGIIKRIKKDRKLLVAIQGVVVVAISNVPARFLERIDAPELHNEPANTTTKRTS